jgi:O-antigen/teichoic acid export membrane protein
VASNRLAVVALGRIRTACLTLAAVLAVALFVTAPWLVRSVFGPQFAGAVTPLRILLLAELFISSYFLDTTTIAARGRPGYSTLVAFVGFTTVTMLDLVLIPRHGIVGAAWASVAGYMLMAILSRATVLWMRAGDGNRE